MVRIDPENLRAGSEASSEKIGFARGFFCLFFVCNTHEFTPITTRNVDFCKKTEIWARKAHV